MTPVVLFDVQVLHCSNFTKLRIITSYNPWKNSWKLILGWFLYHCEYTILEATAFAAAAIPGILSMKEVNKALFSIKKISHDKKAFLFSCDDMYVIFVKHHLNNVHIWSIFNAKNFTFFSNELKKLPAIFF